MADTGAKLPTQAVSASEAPWSDNDWVAPGNVTADDGTAASVTAATFDAGDRTYVLKATGFDFSAIPDGAIINGVVCVVNAWYATAAASIDLMQLLDTSLNKVGTNQCSSPAALGTDNTGTVTKGSSSDTWGNSLDSAWVKNANFGVALGCLAGGSGNNNVDVYIDYVSLQVFYSAAPLTVDKYDSVGIQESVTAVARVLSGTVSDSAIVQESVTLRARMLYGTDYEQVTVQDVVTVQAKTLSVNVFDTVSVTENVNVAIDLSVRQADGITVTDGVQTNVLLLSVFVYDSVSFIDTNGTELPTTTGPIQATLSTWVDGADPTTAQMTPPAGKDVGSFDTGQISETKETPGSTDIAKDHYTELEWCLNITDQAELGATYEFRLLADNIVIDIYTETPILTIAAAALLSVDVGDVLSLTDYSNAFGEVFLFTSCYDSVSAGDSTRILLNPLKIAVMDTLSLTGAISARSLLFGVNVYEALVVTEVATERMPLLLVSVSDSVVALEQGQPNVKYLQFSLYDTLGIGDNARAMIPVLLVSRYDSITLQDNVQILIPINYIRAYDTLSVQDVISAIRNTIPGCRGSENVLVLDTVSVMALLGSYTGGDVIGITDFAEAMSVILQRIVGDSIGVTDAITCQYSLTELNSFDNVILQDIVFTRPGLYSLLTGDVISISDVIQILLGLGFHDIVDLNSGAKRELDLSSVGVNGTIGVGNKLGRIIGLGSGLKKTNLINSSGSKTVTLHSEL